MKSQWKFWYQGAWRPVMNLIRGEHEVAHPEQANKVVIYVGPGEWVAHVANPGEIFSTGEPAAGLPCDWDSI